MIRARTLIKNHECEFCKRQVLGGNITKHENSCYLNPRNKRLCPVCNEPIKYYHQNRTCSVSCANSLFRSGPAHPNWKNNYIPTCFYYHKKECVICGEKNLVEVHHLDENKKNNSPENLIPLCPTHHQYWHSRFRYLVEPKIRAYILDWHNDAGIRRMHERKLSRLRTRFKPRYPRLKLGQ